MEHKICVLIFSTNFDRNISHSKNYWSRFNQNVHKYSCEVPVILLKEREAFRDRLSRNPANVENMVSS